MYYGFVTQTAHLNDWMKMANQIERMQETMNKIWLFILGDHTTVDDPMKWYNYIILAVKVAIPILAIYFLIVKNYQLAIIFFIGFLLDIYMFTQVYIRYKAYKARTEIEDCLKIK